MPAFVYLLLALLLPYWIIRAAVRAGVRLALQDSLLSPIIQRGVANLKESA